jgi:hypothetical protein
MNKMLERAIAQLARLPEEEQEAYGLQLLEEMESERGWDERFAKSQDLLGAMAAQVREEVARGDILPCDPSDRPSR